MSISIKSIYTLLLPLSLLLLSACVDDRLMYPDNYYRDGETVLNLEANFRPFTEGNLTRADIENGNGKALADIKSLKILVYDTDGVLLPAYTKDLKRDKFKVEDNNRTPQTGNPIAETSTKTVSDISLKIPFGEYYIIAIANPKASASYNTSTLDELFSSKVKWEEGAAGDISSNGEMLGYFTDSSEGGGWPISLTTIKTVKVNRPGITLRAWLRRCASKITIDFDGSQLRDNVTVYIKQAKIYDIPYDCTLGFGSTLTSSGNTDSAEGEANPATSENTATYNNTVDSKDITSGGFYEASSQVISYLNEETPATRADAANGNAVNTPTTDYDGWEKWPSVTKASPYLYDDTDKVKFHSETAQALYFYENMQDNSTEPKQTKTALLDFANGGMVYKAKDGMDYGTYIEVEAYYKSDAIGNVSQGVVRYRFMLGKNATDNFEAERNYHYKLTLKLKGNGNDGDWHIDFKEQVLEVTQPKEVNYQGQFFVPNASIDNLGHEFSKDNVITVTSYMDYLGDAGKTTQIAEAWTLSYMETDDETGRYPTEDKAVFKEGLPTWIEYSFKDVSVDEKTGQLAKELVFTTAMRNGDEVREVKINDDLKDSKNSVSGKYNLSNSKGEQKIGNTANCYIVKGSGTYQIPLVYGNAVTDSVTNEKSYKTGALSVITTYPNLVYSKDGRDFSLPTLKNHLNNDITSPYIEKNAGCTPNEAVIVWQDAENLITGVSYEANALTAEKGKVGAIEFTVDNGNIKEGNAVLAIKDSEGRIMWSWHIWVTNFSSLEETIKMEDVQLPEAVVNESPSEFEILPVNLGWCSGGEKILYYPERRCKIRFTAGTMYRDIEIVQRSHMAFPRGNSVYYQWGRKDPFWGTGSKNGNKEIFSTEEVADTEGYPKRFYADGMNVTNDLKDKGDTSKGFKHERQTTYFLFKGTEPSDEDNVNDGSEWYFEYGSGNRLIQQPARWHNPPRKEHPDNKPDMGDDEKKYVSQNSIYYNLWGQINPDTWVYDGVKTVYDPTPAGYIVPPYTLFSCFTTSGLLFKDEDLGQPIDVNGQYGSRKWYEVSPGNIPEANRSTNLFEFYTSKSKLQSVIFPESGYRDWDATAKVIDIDISKGYAWTRMMKVLSFSNDDKIGCTFDPKESSTDAECAYNFEFSRNKKLVRPNNEFNTCNGMPVRPMKIK